MAAPGDHHKEPRRGRAPRPVGLGPGPAGLSHAGGRNVPFGPRSRAAEPAQWIMATTQDVAQGPTLEEMDRAECVRLLGKAIIGRVVLSVDCIPIALPVNVSVVDGYVVFGTDSGTKLDAAVRGAVVTVEADDIDRVYQTGWSVLVTGVATVITDPGEIERTTKLVAPPWALRKPLFLVRVPMTKVSGRRIAWDHQANNTSSP